MKIFHCDHCDQLVFFENSKCLSCGHDLAFFVERLELGSLEAESENLWKTPRDLGMHRFRLCGNYRNHNVCNWAVPADDPHELCVSCRLTRVIPNLTKPENHESWYKLETAKRRLVYSLLALGLPLKDKTEDPAQGLAFEFLEDPEPQIGNGTVVEPVLTGHSDGVIVINIAEAHDPEREKRRVAMHEPYRTLLGHFRHEVGHYYWDRLIFNTDRLQAFRNLFGNEEEDYGEALNRHYQQGPQANWQERFISAYASSHPWEDWAESWAHYLHMIDTIESASVCGLSLKPKRRDEPALNPNALPASTPESSFKALINSWFSLTYLLNNLNRGLGLQDGYPFVLSTPVIEKLQFIHETVGPFARR